MFTVRVMRAGSAHVQACCQYVAEHQPDGRTVLSLYAEAGPIAPQTAVATIALDEQTRAFVMNDHGKTVDTYLGGRGYRR